MLKPDYDVGQQIADTAPPTTRQVIDSIGLFFDRYRFIYFKFIEALVSKNVEKSIVNRSSISLGSTEDQKRLENAIETIIKNFRRKYTSLAIDSELYHFVQAIEKALEENRVARTNIFRHGNHSLQIENIWIALSSLNQIKSILEHSETENQPLSVPSATTAIYDNESLSA